MGANSNSVYAKNFSFQYRGLAFKREDTIGGEHTKVKNVAEGGFGNINLSAGYKRGTEGKMSTISTEASASAFQLKDTASAVIKDKDYKAFSAEVSLLKGSASAKIDQYGVATAKASAHLAGGEASASVGGIQVAKVSGGIGTVSVIASSLTGEIKTSANMEKASASIGNNVTLAEKKVTDGEVKSSSVFTSEPLKVERDDNGNATGVKVFGLNVDQSTAMNVKKDVDAVKDALHGKLGTDLTQKGEVKIDVDSKKVDSAIESSGGNLKESSDTYERDKISESEDVRESSFTEDKIDSRENVLENREKELWGEQGKMAKDAFESAEAPIEKDKYGNDYKTLSREEAKDLSDKLKSQIDKVPKGEGGNYRVPEPEKIKGISVNDSGEARIVENWKDGTDGAKQGTRHMETVKAIGEDGKTTVIDRIGGENGNYFAPMNAEGEPYSLKERATGDYLPNKDMRDNDSYHPYEVKQDFTRENFEKAINDTYDDQDVREDKMDALNAYYNDASSESYTNGHDGEKYCNCTPEKADGVKTGEIDKMFLEDGDEYGKGTDGGGEQYITPFSAKELIEMGMIEEI